tara:strand:- start:646 stop:909 length:264 start_codon:yes stop_codon:yes gene_type:complete
LSINQDVLLYKINPDQLPTWVKLDPHRCQFLEVGEGMCSVDGQILQAGVMVYDKDESQVTRSVAWEVSFSISIYRDKVSRDLLLKRN